jgi:hypothetical protein
MESFPASAKIAMLPVLVSTMVSAPDVPTVSCASWKLAGSTAPAPK